MRSNINNPNFAFTLATPGTTTQLILHYNGQYLAGRGR